IVVFPEGDGRRWNDGRVETHRTLFDKPIARADDVGFLSLLIDTLTDKYPVDRGRVFSTGISNGGFMSFRLAMDLSHKIKAIAPVTAQISLAIAHKKPLSPVSLMLINGTEDPLVPYKGGHVRLGPRAKSRGEILSTEESIARFVEVNGCRGRPRVQDLPDVDRRDGTTVTKTRYDVCRDGTEVVLLTVHGGGHTWPGGVQYLPERRIGRVSRDINATQMIADFFLGLPR
ncbi:MAG: esterase, partial [Candidatus Omnitrophica bacterium]|nr:esterase [Candidatus Omnitrophota bacterium]